MNLCTMEAFKRMKLGEAVELDAEELRRLQRVLSGMLADVVAFCLAHGISYFVGGGTSLGALRHGGFIPWDDDIDFCLSRNDFGRFCSAFAADLGGKYHLHTPQGTSGLGLCFARIRKRGTSVRTRDDVTCDNARLANDECGAFIDVFVIENTPDNALLRWLHGLGSMALGFLYSCRRFFHDRRVLTAWAEENPSLRRAVRIKGTIGCLLCWMKLDGWVRLWDRWNGCCRNAGSRFVAIPVGKRHYFGEMARREDYFGSRTLPFEGLTVSVPTALEDYLTRLYGPDYATPQESGNRERHVFFRPFSLSTDLI